jgi:DNA transformation protein
MPFLTVPGPRIPNNEQIMPITNSYLDYVLDQLRPFGETTARRMFGGAGLFRDNLMFGLIADDVLYFKVDDSNRPDYETKGMEPFRPWEKSPVISYFQVPIEVLEDSETLHEWAKKALAIARQKAKEKAKKKSTSAKRSKGGR